MLHALRLPGGLLDALVNADEVCADVWQRAQREAPHSAALRPQLPRHLAWPASARLAPPRPAPPLLEIVMRTTDGGVLRFYSVFTTFGAPLDMTAASLRVAHFFPVDDATRPRLTDATARLAGCTAAACLPARPVAHPATRPATRPETRPPARRDNAASP